MRIPFVYMWHERLGSGRESVEDGEPGVRPSTFKSDENIEKVKEIMAEKLTIRELAEDLNIAYGSIQDILVNVLGCKASRKISCKKREHVDMAKDLIFTAEPDPTFIKRIITRDETWIYKYDAESRHQASEWRTLNEPRSKKPRLFQRKKNKAFLMVFMYYNGIVHQ